MQYSLFALDLASRLCYNRHIDPNGIPGGSMELFATILGILAVAMFVPEKEAVV